MGRWTEMEKKMGKVTDTAYSYDESVSDDVYHFSNAPDGTQNAKILSLPLEN